MSEPQLNTSTISSPTSLSLGRLASRLKPWSQKQELREWRRRKQNQKGRRRGHLRIVGSCTPSYIIEQGMCAMHDPFSVFVTRCRFSVSIGEESVVEYCILEPRVTIGKKCIVSNLHLPAGVCVPDCSFLHTVPLDEEDGTIHYTTFTFGMYILMCLGVCG